MHACGIGLYTIFSSVPPTPSPVTKLQEFSKETKELLPLGLHISWDQKQAIDLTTY